jgi:uncharacterized protein (TIGR02145 family)
MRRRIILGGDDSEAVDLGIISGGKKILWATKNVDVNSVTDYGNYYQYGKGSRTYEQTSGETPYQGTENPLTLSADTAYQLMGEGWRMPTNEECIRLTASTNHSWTTINGVNGSEFTSKTDSSKFIFLPAGGYWTNGTKYNFNTVCRYLTSSTNNDENWSYFFETEDGYASTKYLSRIIGCSVRGVKEVPLDESDLNGHQFVDLGLPSGTLWARTNVGSDTSTGYGNYYQYGRGSRTYEQTSGETPYQGTENPLALSADTAHQVWGGLWHMPTLTQVNELFEWTNYSAIIIDGVYGGKFTSKTDSSKFIFLPAGGYWDNGIQSVVESDGFFWSSTPNGSTTAFCFYFDYSYSENKGITTTYRRRGHSVRPVIG